MDTQPKPTYTNYELKRALTAVFRSAWFDTTDIRQITQDSYFDNFYQLVDYARANNLDEMEYIKSIQNCFPLRIDRLRKKCKCYE